jgi:O-antigen/teichoic acid export membrane protein
MSRIQSGIDFAQRATRAFTRSGASHLSTSMVLVLGLGFLQNLLLARILGTDGVGHMAVVYSTMTVAALLGTAGVTSSILRYGAAAPNEGAAWLLYRTGLRWCAGIAVSVAALTAVLSQTRAWVFDPVAGAWLPWIAIGLPAQALGACASHFLQARGAMREKAIVDFASRLVTVGAVLTGSLLRGFDGAVVGYTIGSIAGGTLAVARAWTLRAATPAAPWVPTRELMRFGAWGLLTNALGLGLVTADIFCVSALVRDAGQVGVYFLAGQLQQIVGIPTRAYLDARFPEMTRLSADPSSLRALWRRMRWQLVGVSTLGSVGLALVAPFALPVVFGRDFAASSMPLAILLLGQIARSWGDAPGRAMFASGWVEGNFWLSVLSAGLTIGGNLALIPPFGIAGAALGTALAYAIWAICTTAVGNWFDRRRLGGR